MKDVVRIIIKGSSGYGPSTLGYEDRLVIEPAGISYEYRPMEESELNPRRKWAYRTICGEYAELYEGVLKELPRIMELDEDLYCTDIGVKSFTVTFSDKTRWHEDFFLPGNTFRNMFRIIKRMVPQYERIPNVIMTDEDHEEE